MWKLKLKLFFMNYIRPNKIKIAAALATLIAILAIVTASLHYINSHRRFFYRDLNGNIGIAASCETLPQQLICDREYGGRVVVQSYWEGK